MSRLKPRPTKHIYETASSGLYQLIVYQYDVMARHIVNAIASIKDAIIVQKQLLHPTRSYLIKYRNFTYRLN